jgi:kynurenine formamidase
MAEAGDSPLLALASSARIYDLEQPRHINAPTYSAHQPGFLYTLHRRHEPGLGETRSSASGRIITADHSGTHIDALCHQAEAMVMHGDCAVTPRIQTPNGFTHLGVETIPPILARGVLLDLAGAAGVDRLASGHVATAEELELAEEYAGLVVSEGDAVLIRTGNGAVFDQVDAYLDGAGLGAAAGRWLAERHPLLVGADNVAFDVIDHRDPELGTLPCHVLLLVRAGVYIVENLNLEELAGDGVSEFLLVCLPLKMQGVTGSPVRPIALVLSQQPRQ